jgi:ElaB/YqjD/DUF883 family membrane-anchored ribosome-binding protein
MNTSDSTPESNMENSPNDFTKEQLMADFKVVVEDAEELLKATAGQGGDKLAEGRAKVRIAEAQAALLAKTREAAKATDVYVHDNPWEAVGVAAAAGFIVGWMVGRR